MNFGCRLISGGQLARLVRRLAAIKPSAAPPPADGAAR